MRYFKFLVLLCYLALLSCQSESDEWDDWIRENAHEISLSDTTSYADLNFLKEILKGKRIVFLGENSHGVSEFTMVKSRLIRFLHEELDFDVLAFEVNAGDAFAANYFNTYTDTDSSIYNAISTFWHVEEIVPLFNYIHNSRSTDDPLILAGVDITQSNGSYAFSRYLYQWITTIDSTYAQKIRQKDSVFSRLGVRKWTIGNIMDKDERWEYELLKNELLDEYTQLIQLLNQNRNHLVEKEGLELETVLFYLQSRVNFIHWVNKDSAYMANFLNLAPERKKTINWLFPRYRDKLMSQNLAFLARTLYPNKKIIVWAHNSHIKRYPNRMPFELSQTDSTYSISLNSYSGKGCFSFGQGFDGTPPDSMVYEYKTPENPLSVESILHKGGYPVAFVDFRYQSRHSGNSWMFDKSTYSDWDGSISAETENIRKIWDAIILVDNISPPKYLEYKYDYLSPNHKDSTNDKMNHRMMGRF